MAAKAFYLCLLYSELMILNQSYPGDNILGFARVVTDKVVFAYLMDLFIFEEYQGNGLGTKY